jgi:hypothetical protein
MYSRYETQLRQVSMDRSARQISLDRMARTWQEGEDIWDRTTGRGQPWQESQDVSTGAKLRDRTAGTGQRRKVGMTFQPGHVCLVRNDSMKQHDSNEK